MPSITASSDQRFELVSEYGPMGDQPAAIDQLVRGVELGEKYQTLLGATGTGKTFTMANTIARVQKPTLVLSHNKTLAAQLYEELKEYFPHNAVSYFVSYYDYYQPEAYIPQRDIYIEKDSSRNDDLDRLRLAATTNLVSRRDVIVVASVSCIFGLGSPDEFKKNVVSVYRGQTLSRRDLLRALSDLQYSRSEYELKRGTFRVRGDVVELVPAGEEYAVRIEFFGDEVETIALVNPTTAELLAEESAVFIYPAVHYVLPEDRQQQALDGIREELEHRVMELRQEGKLLEAQRIQARTQHDLEMLQEVGMCSGIENYSRHLDGRPPGSKPYTLLDYFPDAQSGEYRGAYQYRTPEDPEGRESDRAIERSSDPDSDPHSIARSLDHSITPDDDTSPGWLMFIDESHVTLPQVKAMYNGDRMRKQTLVEHGFRLPSAMDNRPLTFDEVEKVWDQVVFVSATPSAYELEKSKGVYAEQIIRPTGLVDPVIEVSPAENQVPDLLEKIKERVGKNERVLVTTLTKRLAEDLSGYFADEGVRCRYMHSDVETLDRVTILRELREGQFDVLVGVNLLREGLDLPEVSMVAIMDADKTGFLRSPTSLIQTIGRSARNVNAYVVMYADQITPAMQNAIDETERRRTKQLAFNQEHGITPQTIKKAIRRGIEIELKARKTAHGKMEGDDEEVDKAELIEELEKQMLEAAQAMEFEKAADLRDRVQELKNAPDMGPIKRGRGKSQKAKPGTPGTKAGKRGKRQSRR
jgi:excinuclease ABC subunit B